MAVGFEVEEISGGIFMLKGMIDESAKFGVFASKSSPLRLNLRDIRGVNSLGLRHLLNFLRDWQPKEFEYHECPLCFVDTINILPQALGNPPKPERCRSFMLPFVCPHCREPIEQLVHYADLKISGKEVDMPDYECKDCNAILEMDGDPEDYFLFITCPA